MELLNTLKDAGLLLLQALIIAAVPVILTFVSKLLNAKANEVKANTANANITNVIDTLFGIVDKAVDYVGQTYVDNLKKNGLFNVEEQAIAFDMAFDRIVELLTEESKQIIDSVFGNFSALLQTLIEASIAETKPAETKPAETILIETKPIEQLPV